MAVIVVATAFPIPEHREEVITAFEAAEAKVHTEEDGCELYALHEGAGEFVMVERWASPEALAVHGKAEALTALGAALAGKVAGPPKVRRLDAVPAGEAGKGAL